MVIKVDILVEKSSFTDFMFMSHLERQKSLQRGMLLSLKDEEINCAPVMWKVNFFKKSVKIDNRSSNTGCEIVN